jgi:hypothetical protein
MRKTPLKFRGLIGAITHLNMTVTLLYVVKTNIHVVMACVSHPTNLATMLTISFFVEIFFSIARHTTIIHQTTSPSIVGF